MKTIRHTGIVVSDLRRSLHFYQGLLGLKEVRTMTEASEYIDKILGGEGIKVTTVKLSADDGNLIELLYFYSPKVNFVSSSLFNLGLTHMAFEVNDVDQEYKKLSEAGVAFHSVPQLSPKDEAKVAFCQGPDGEWLELVEIKK